MRSRLPTSPISRPPRTSSAVTTTASKRCSSSIGIRPTTCADGFNVYSTEVEQALMAHPAVADCAVVGLPDDKWGERVTAVLQLRPGQDVDAPDVQVFVKERIGSVKAPKQVEVWADLPRSKVGKVLTTEIKRTLLDESQGARRAPR